MAMTESASRPSDRLPGRGRPPRRSACSASPPTPRRGPLDARLAGDERISVATVTTPAAVPAHVDAADCVVLGPGLSEDDYLELLGTIRERNQAVPVVLLAPDSSRAVRDALGELEWGDLIRPATTRCERERLANRIRALVGYRRATALARRSLAALAHGSDAVAIVAPDGTVEYVNPCSPASSARPHRSSSVVRGGRCSPTPKWTAWRRTPSPASRTAGAGSATASFAGRTTPPSPPRRASTRSTTTAWCSPSRPARRGELIRALRPSRSVRSLSPAVPPLPLFRLSASLTPSPGRPRTATAGSQPSTSPIPRRTTRRDSGPRRQSLSLVARTRRAPPAASRRTS